MDMLIMMLGYDVDGVNQSLSPQLTITRSAADIVDGGDISSLALASSTSTPPTLDINDFPYGQLLKNEWWNRNISRMLNITEDNLTSLLTAAQQQQSPDETPQQQQQQHSERDSVGLVITLTVFYALIFVAGVLGNLITCIVISRNKFMHTATNFYLFNLAVSDLILLLSGMPQDLYNIWNPRSYPFTKVLCVMESVLSETAANATVLTITAFTVERYIAICHPFRQHTMSKLSRAIKFIFAIWIMAFLLALPQAMQFSVVVQDTNTSCTMQNDFFAHVFAVSGFIFFGGPMTAICVLYVLIGVKLKRSRLLQTVPRRCYDVQRGINAQTRVIRMLVAVAVAFFLCWAPFHAQRLMAVYGSTANIDSPVFNEIFHVLDYTSGVLYFLSTCINPLLYNIMSHKFREAFKVTLARHFGLAARYQTQNHNYSAMRRQNGSMRLHTTVNNNALDHHLNSYRVVQAHCRDPSHRLSLQDSMRTTTTTINSASSNGPGTGGGAGHLNNCNNNNCRSASTHRPHRCMMAAGNGGGGGGRGSFMSTVSKGDIFTGRSNSLRDSLPNKGTTTTTIPNTIPQRVLQTQISQLSSLGDANSLLEADGVLYHPHPHPRLKDHRPNSLNRTSSLKFQSDCESMASHDTWQPPPPDETLEMLVTKPVAPPIATTHLPEPIMQSIAEVPSRSRLKLSRIISKRDGDDPSGGRHKSTKTLDSLAEKFRRKGRRKTRSNRDLPEESTISNSNSSTSASASVSSSSTGGGCVTTPTNALMKIVYPVTAVPSAHDKHLRDEIENVGKRNGQLGNYGGTTPSAL